MASAAPPSSSGDGSKGDEADHLVDPNAAPSSQAAEERPWRPPVYIETVIGGESEVNILSNRVKSHCCVAF